MTETSTPIDLPVETPPPPPIKPGWQTTEFWLATAAKVLGILLASGVLGHGTVAERIAGAAVALLAQLGYTAARAAVKMSAALLLVVGLGVVQPACASPRATATVGVAALVDCQAPHLRAAAAELVPMAVQAILRLVSGTGRIDTAAFLAALGGITSDAGRCAVAAAIAILTAPATTPSPAAIAAGAPPADPEELRAAFESVRASWGGASYRTVAGVL